MASWDLHAHLLRAIDFKLAGANWQRGGGKSGSKPKPIPLPGGKGPGGQQAKTRPTGAEFARRLQAAGHIPAGTPIED